jgi:very-short-patch-repair endonuclease
VDFCCLEKRLIIELDGEIHKAQSAEDTTRTNFLEAQGFKVLRFWNSEIMTESDRVLSAIQNMLQIIQRRVSDQRMAMYSWCSPLHTQGRGAGGEGGKT